MDENDVFYTISSKSEGIFKEKGSKFISFAYPFTNSDQLKPILEELKTEFFKARHFCFAYKIGLDDDNFRSNDDGEPSGSAGKPILNTIYSKNLTNVLIVVVRYFGGTLLGVPGLINAYGLAAEDAINNAKIKRKTVNDLFFVEFDYEFMNPIMRIIKDNDLKIKEQTFKIRTGLRFLVRKSLSESVENQINEIQTASLEVVDE